MKFHFVFLWTDILIYILFCMILFLGFFASRSEHWREYWSTISSKKLAMVSFVLILTYALVALLDSIHFNPETSPANTTASLQLPTVLDLLVKPLGQQDEDTYSAPFSLFASAKVTTFIQGKAVSYYPRLKWGGRHLKNVGDHLSDVMQKIFISILLGVLMASILFFIFIYFQSFKKKVPISTAVKFFLRGASHTAWREIFLTLTGVLIIIATIKIISPYYHLLGTNKIGVDTLYETIKSIRTGLIIGTLTTLVMLPFAIVLGTMAGYFGGWIDDIIQYLYITLSSIPGVLLITASVLSLQLFIANHPQLFPTLESRADARLLALCVILGITSWTSLCRLLRAETLKLREIDYVKAAVAIGVYHSKIIWRHILPNVVHIILITLVLDFSALVLAEAVLSYVGVGVDPTTPSWGNMINSARLDLAREPVVWWPLFAAFIFMFFLVLPANLFADSLRDALDPHLRNEH